MAYEMSGFLHATGDFEDWISIPRADKRRYEEPGCTTASCIMVSAEPYTVVCTAALDMVEVTT